MKNNKFAVMYRNFITHMKQDKGPFIIYIILRTLVVITMIAQFFNKNYENVFFCVLTLILLVIPELIEMKFNIDLPDTMEIIILLFIFAAEILGEIQEYYIIFPFWDTMLHTMNGFLCAAIGFALIDILNRMDRITFRLSPIFVVMVAFCFSMTIGVLWEFFEFGMDMIFLKDMQKDTIINTISTVMLDPMGRNQTFIIKDISEVAVNGTDLALGGYLDIGLIDTMKDLIVNFIGAVVFSFIGYFYLKRRGNSKIASHFIPLRKNSNPSQD